MLLQNFEEALASEPVGRALLARAGVPTSDMEALLSSGFFAIGQDILPTDLELLLMNAEPIDLMHPSFDASKYRRYAQPIDVNIAIVDRHTGAIFRPAQLNPAAAFGVSGDTIDLSYLGLNTAAIGRSRFREFPYYVAKSVDTLAGLCESLRTHMAGSGFEILFRGQTKEHLVRRAPQVLEFLYGTASVREPSLPSNAFRNRFNYAAAEPYVRLILRDIVYRRNRRENRKHWVEDRFEQLNLLSHGHELSQALDDVMGIGQHYGIPTYGIDATSSWETAFWFATHKFASENGKASFSEHRWEVGDSGTWPVVYVLRTRNALDLSLMSFPSIRAKAQNAFFLPGSWGLHGNVAANDIICAIQLHPAAGVDPHEVSEIFPMPSSDFMYRELLEAKQRTLSASLSATIGLDQVFDLTYA